MKITSRAIIALIFALSELSLLPVMLDIGGRGIGTIQLLFYAFIVGSVASVVVSYRVNKINGIINIIKSGKILVIVIIAGLLNDVISQLLLGIGTIGTNPIIAATIFRSWTIMAAVLIPFTLKQKVTNAQLLATIIGFAGVYLLASNGAFLSINITALPFILILLGSALCVVYPNLAMKQYNVDTFGAIALFNIASLVFISILVLFTNTNVIIQFSYRTVSAILFLGIFTYGVGTSLYYYSLKTFGPLFMGNSILIVPFLTIVFSYLILSTPVHTYYIIAAILLNVGIIMQQKFSKAPERISKRMLNKLQIFDITSAFVNNKSPTVSHYLSGNNRALVIKLHPKIGITTKQMDIFTKYECIAFTNKKVPPEISKEEIDFVNDIMQTKKEDILLIGMGIPDRLDESFFEFMKVQKLF